MEIFTLISIGVVAAFLGYFLGNREARERAITFVNTEQRGRKENRKKMIMAELSERGRITNDEVQEFFDVAHSTATNYFDELQDEGRIVERGEGRGIYYEKA